jgi:hypothetical protein
MNEQYNTTCIMEQEESALLYDLANSILEECKDAAMLSDLDTAIYLFCEALNQRPAPHPLQSDSIKDLAAALVTRFSLTNQRHDLAQAISLLTEGMDGLYDGSAAHGEFWLDVSIRSVAVLKLELEISIEIFFYGGIRPERTC